MKLYLLKSSLQAKFKTDERAASIVEYTVLLAFVAVVAIIGVRFVAMNVSNIFTTVGNSLKRFRIIRRDRVR